MGFEFSLLHAPYASIPQGDITMLHTASREKIGPRNGAPALCIGLTNAESLPLVDEWTKKRAAMALCSFIVAHRGKLCIAFAS